MLPSLRISSLIRIAAIALLGAGAYAKYIQSIGSSMSIFIGLFLSSSLLPIKLKRLTEVGQNAFSLSAESTAILVGLLLGYLYINKPAGVSRKSRPFVILSRR